GIAIFFLSMLSIPVYISFKGSISLTTKILKGNTVIKDWDGGFKAAYIAICVVALLYFVWAMAIIIDIIIRGY
ncbi:MAG: hypothetical protein FWC64_12375, partial [Treponema sp.]|nr:hypothetical protein [Treponema sp.]